MGKRDPIMPDYGIDPVTGLPLGPVDGLYVPRSKAFFDTHDNTKAYSDLDMLDYGDLLRSGEIAPGQVRGRAQHDYENQMKNFEGLDRGTDSGTGFATAATTGTSLGATIGSAIPVVGTGVGAAAGAIGGAAANIFSGNNHGHQTTDQDRDRWAANGGALDMQRQALQPGWGGWQPQFVDQAANTVADKFGKTSDEEEMLEQLKRQRGY